MEALLIKLEELKTENSSNFSKLSDKMDEMKSEMKRMGDSVSLHDDKLKEQARYIAELQAKIEVLETRQFDSEQYSRKNCLRVWGLPSNYDNKEILGKFLEFAKSTLKVDMSMRDIDNIHYLGKGTGRHVIVKFSTFLAKRKVYEARRVLKGVRNEDGQFISLRPDLSPASRILLAQAKQLVSSDGKDNKPFSSVWVTVEGKIWATRGDKRLHLTGPQDLDYVPAGTAGENSILRRKTGAKRLASTSPESRPDMKRVNVFEQLPVDETCP
ncbi:Hypp7610 [Branchiostoma lanceolatum]|uniref:Hypp7610 protein n=1 Tax=Branchiostoma lanceolatum TaxID=7740 RepID=A0A8J9Z1L3_BRALA|nr:Hypp7610 [Branchiostoma lanceolatum]